MLETPTVQQPPPAPQPPTYPPRPYQEYAAVEQPPPAPQTSTYQQQPPLYPPPMYPPPQQPYYGPPVPPPKKKMAGWKIAILIIVVVMVTGFVGLGFLAVVGSQLPKSDGTTSAPVTTQQPAQQVTNPPGTAQPTQPPTATQPPVVVAQPKLLDSVNVFEKAYGKATYTQAVDGKGVYDTGYQFTHDGKDIYVFTLSGKVTAIGMKADASTLADLKPYLPADVGQPTTSSGMDIYPVAGGHVGLGESNGFNMLVYVPNQTQ